MENILTFLLIACFDGIHAKERCAADKIKAELEVKIDQLKRQLAN